MASQRIQGGPGQGPNFIVEMDGRLYLAATVAEYGEAGPGSGSSELRQMFAEGRRSAPLAAVEVGSVKRMGVAVAGSSEGETEPTPAPPPPPPEPVPPSPPPPSPSEPMPSDDPSEPPGVGTEPPAVGTNPD